MIMMKRLEARVNSTEKKIRDDEDTLAVRGVMILMISHYSFLGRQ